MPSKITQALCTCFSLLICQLSFSQSIINAYAKVSSVSGNSILAVSNVNETNHTFNVGDRVIVMQMQDDVIGTNTTNVSTFGNINAIQNAGLYEVAIIGSKSPASGTPTTITLSGSLVNSYSTGSNSAVQVISYRNMGANYTTTSNITGLAWDGNVGGVIAFWVTNTLTVNNSITANAIGFRGGSVSANYSGPVCTTAGPTIYIGAPSNQTGNKGEGIYKSTNTTFDNSRGKIINGGGGGSHHNGGGGGGGNYTAGGLGGNGYQNCTGNPAGGLGGLALSTYIGSSRVFMGGGGGGGQQNNSVGISGGNGGGIILISATRLATAGSCNLSITANGQTTGNAGNDGVGGGGAGGSIVLNVQSYSIASTCQLTISATGGNGGYANQGSGSEHAGGGAGGQGAVIYSTAQPTTNITTSTNNGNPGCNNNTTPCNSPAGSAGGSNNQGILINTTTPLPVELISFDVTYNKTNKLVDIYWKTAQEINCNYYTVESSQNTTDWNLVKKINVAGNSHTEKNYFANDNPLTNGLWYYRLTQTDLNGEKYYFPIKSVFVSGNDDNQVIVFPNPANELVNISSTKVDLKTVVICNMLGNKVFEENPKALTLTIKLSEFAKGVYVVKSFSELGKVYTSRLIIH